MVNLEDFSRKIAGNIKNNLDLDEDRTSIIQYGLHAFFHMALSIIMVMIVGAIFNIMIEALLVSFVISIFRKYSGGAHASTSVNCAIIGVIISVVPALIISRSKVNVNWSILIGLIIFITSIAITYRLAPVDSPNKPIRKKEKIKRLKKGSIIILTMYSIIATLNILLYYYTKNNRFLIFCNCIYIGVIWQVFTLTKIGHRVMKIIDSLFIKFKKERRYENEKDK